MDQIKTDLELSSYKDTKSSFSDFTHFEGKFERRTAERNAFINNLEYTPNYDYPKLDFLIDNGDISEKKREIYEAVMELEVAKGYPDANTAEIELFASFHEMRLKKIMLVEAARNLHNYISMSDTEVNRRSFAELNEAIYGEFDTVCYLGMIATEKSRLASFVPKSEAAADIKHRLDLSLRGIDVNDEKEEALVDEATMQKLHNFIVEHYFNVLDVVPNTPNDVYYDVTQCAEIMNRALEAGGLAQFGWTAAENSAKTTPTTMPASKKINLPSNTRRNASELRRLIIHEQEVHARRAQNGRDSGLGPIATGTANYADIEEGLGILLECSVDGNLSNPSFDRSRNRYITAGLALGADGRPRDAREVYETLWRIIAIQKADDGDITEGVIKKSKDMAYTHIENAFRGTQFWMKGVIYTKLKVYYEGLAKNADYFKSNIDNLDAVFEDVFIGKYDHTDPVEKNLVMSAIAARKTK